MFVAVRIRPLFAKEIDNGQKKCCDQIDGKIVTIKKGAQAGGYLRSQLGSLNEYAFDAVFDESATQLDVFDGTAKTFLNEMMEGTNVTVFAYGATGAGKTHTLMGNTRRDNASKSTEAGGIIPNSVNDLFASIKNKTGKAAIGEKWTLNVSYCEVYNEQVYDLLEPSGKILSVREDCKGTVIVAGVTEKVVTSAEAVFDLLDIGNRNRKTEATMANEVSSRSHAVLQMTLHHVRLKEGGREAVTESKLSLIDLAGSERASATNNRGARLQEGANINKSLLALANCINALSISSTSKIKMNVKYRDSKLTHLLKSSLEGNCRVVMIANVNPSHTTFEDSHNTLKYANRAKNIKLNVPGSATANAEVEKSSSWLERETRMRNENSELQKKVAYLESVVSKMQSSFQTLRSHGILAFNKDLLDAARSDLDVVDSINSAVTTLDSIDIGIEMEGNGRHQESSEIAQPTQEASAAVHRRHSILALDNIDETELDGEYEAQTSAVKHPLRRGKKRSSMCAEVMSSLSSLRQKSAVVPDDAVEKTRVPAPSVKGSTNDRKRRYLVEENDQQEVEPVAVLSPLSSNKKPKMSKKKAVDFEVLPVNESSVMNEEAVDEPPLNYTPWGEATSAMLSDAVLSAGLFSTSPGGDSKSASPASSPPLPVTSSPKHHRLQGLRSPLANKKKMSPLRHATALSVDTSAVCEEDVLPKPLVANKKRRGSYIPKLAPQPAGGGKGVEVATSRSVPNKATLFTAEDHDASPAPNPFQPPPQAPGARRSNRLSMNAAARNGALLSPKKTSGKRIGKVIGGMMNRINGNA